MKRTTLSISFLLVLALSSCKDKSTDNGNDKPPTMPFSYPPVDSYPSWSPDGSRIIYNMLDSQYEFI